MKSARVLLTVIAVLSVMMFSRLALASCTAYGYSYRYTTFATQNYTVAKNQAPNTPIGNAITLIPTSASTIGTYTCTGSTWHFYQGISGLQESKYPGIFKTGVPGIGMKLTASNGAVVGVNPNRFFGPYYCPGCHHFSSTDSYYTLQFYVIDPVQTGDVVLNGTYISGWVNDANSRGIYSGSMSISGTVKFKSGSCTTPNITVNLNNHAASDFASVGATSAPVPFNFEINKCDPGLTSVSYTFQPASGVTLQGSGNNQYLTLDSSSTASGVGVQVLYDDGITAVPFNTKTAFSGYNTSTGGSYTIPMKARYVRTGTISPGTANSAAEFVMAYE